MAWGRVFVIDDNFNRQRALDEQKRVFASDLYLGMLKDTVGKPFGREMLDYIHNLVSEEMEKYKPIFAALV